VELEREQLRVYRAEARAFGIKARVSVAKARASVAETRSFLKKNSPASVRSGYSPHLALLLWLSNSCFDRHPVSSALVPSFQATSCIDVRMEYPFYITTLTQSLQYSECLTSEIVFSFFVWISVICG
jgi:hypothetical protein